MFKIKRPREAGKTVSTTIEVGNKQLQVELIPLPEREYSTAFQPFRKSKQITDPVSKRPVLVPYFDETNLKFLEVADDLLDKHWVGFADVEDENGRPVEVTKANKLMLGSIKISATEQIKLTDANGEIMLMDNPVEKTLRMIIIDKCSELSRATVEEEIKNSGTSQPAIAEAGS